MSSQFPTEPELIAISLIFGPPSPPDKTAPIGTATAFRDVMHVIWPLERGQYALWHALNSYALYRNWYWSKHAAPD